MNRKERRAAAHKTAKLARKAGFPVTAQKPQPTTPKPGSPFVMNTSARGDSISEARLAANRANAQHSTGPVTSAGRANSSQNHTTHGLARHNGAFVLLPTEDPAGFEALKTALAAEHQPSTETESILIITMAESHWLANRAQNLQAGCFDPQTGQISDAKMFSLYLRYQTTHARAFHKSLNDLLKIRAERRKVQNGFEAQERRDEKLRMKIREYQMKQQVDAEQQAFQNPEFRAEMIAVGMASLKKGPEYEALKAQFHEKWFPKKEESQAAAA
jgi:hypothetical protein